MKMTRQGHHKCSRKRKDFVMLRGKTIMNKQQYVTFLTKQ